MLSVRFGVAQNLIHMIGEKLGEREDFYSLMFIKVPSHNKITYEIIKAIWVSMYKKQNNSVIKAFS